jgi:hypothetical protein
MSDVREMRKVLQRVESKLVASREIYAGIQYTSWVAILSMYVALYTLLGSKFTEGPIMGVFWAGALALIIYVNMVVWKKMGHLSGRAVMGAWAGWVIGVAFWFILPPAMGFLAFIALGNLWMSVATRDYRMAIPAVASIGAMPLVQATAEPWLMAVGFVMFGYAITSLLYMLGAFKLAGEE